MKDAVAAATVYALLTLFGWLWYLSTRPLTCPKGHTDLYCLGRWRCRTCEREAMNRRLRREARRHIQAQRQRP